MSFKITQSFTEIKFDIVKCKCTESNNKSIQYLFSGDFKITNTTFKWFLSIGYRITKLFGTK